MNIRKLALLAFLVFVTYVIVVTTSVILHPIYQTGMQAIRGLQAIQ